MDAIAPYDATGSPEAGQDGSELIEPDARSGDAEAPDAFVDAGPSPCDFAGTWATKIDFAVSWSGNLGIDSGTGTGYIWLKHESTANGAIVSGTMVACGLSLPGFGFTVFAGGGTGRVNFLGIPLFDNAPPAASTEPVLQIQGAGFPGDAMVLSPTAWVIGATMADPLGGTWPSASQIVTTDLDGDGSPAVTVPHLNSGGYVYLPISPFGASRSEAGYYAARIVVSMSGSVVSCDEAMGQADVMTFDSHLVGCRRVGGAECNSTEVNLLESFRPNYVPGAGTYRLTKVANNAPCTAVRSALP